MLDDHLRLRLQRIRVQRREPGESRPPLARLHLRIVARVRVGELVVHAVRRVVRQHVEDEPLRDRLPHRERVERPLVPVRTDLPERVECLRLRRRCEREERQVLLLAPVPRAGEQRLVCCVNGSVVCRLLGFRCRLQFGVAFPRTQDLLQLGDRVSTR